MPCSGKSKGFGNIFKKLLFKKTNKGAKGEVRPKSGWLKLIHVFQHGEISGNFKTSEKITKHSKIEKEL